MPEVFATPVFKRIATRKDGRRNRRVAVQRNSSVLSLLACFAGAGGLIVRRRGPRRPGPALAEIVAMSAEAPAVRRQVRPTRGERIKKAVDGR